MRCFLTLILILVSAGTASAAPAEMRSAVVLSIDGVPKEIQSKLTEIAINRIDQLADAGFNTIHLEYSDSPFFTQSLIEAHRRGLLVMVTFRSSFVMPKGELKQNNIEPDWLTRDIEVSDADQDVTLNPFHPQVQKWLIDRASNIARLFDVDGIQLNFDVPATLGFGFDDYTARLYKDETNRDLPSKCDDAEFTSWRTEKLSEFALAYVSALRAMHPDLILSADIPFVRQTNGSAIDWRSWLKWCECGGKRFDDISISLIASSSDLEYFKSQLGWITHDLGAIEKMFVSILSPIGENDPANRIQLVRGQELSGFVIFDAGDAVSGIDGFKSTFDVKQLGRAHHPLKPANWREPSISATREGDVFVADLKEGNRYHVIVKKDGIWNDIGSFDLKPGRNTFLQDGDGLELMVDRRP